MRAKTIIKISEDYLLSLYKINGTVFMSRFELKASLAKKCRNHSVEKVLVIFIPKMHLAQLKKK